MSKRHGGGARRPPVKKAHVAVSPRARLTRRPPTAPRRPEGIRWVRSDGSPNWSQRLAVRQGEVAQVASRPPIGVSPSSTVLEAAEVMAENNVRGLVLVDAKGHLHGVLMATDIVNYLGGGEYFGIVENRHKLNIYSALRDEQVVSISNPSPAYIYTTTSLADAVKLMVIEGIGFLPVVNVEEVAYGVVTEHDIVRTYLGEEYMGIKVGEVASKNIVAVGIEDTLRKAAELMVRHGFRRLPVLGSDNSIKGMITAKDIVRFFGSHRAFEFVTTGDINEVLETPVYELMEPGILTVEASADVSEAARLMREHNVGSLIVLDEKGEAVGIITERDVVVAIALERGGG
ncbi:MAG: CBS domain-containing protein [Desulfurococcales archaeon]|nr:CBS domain-containing protein [Desulfurococcales archaeon]